MLLNEINQQSVLDLLQTSDFKMQMKTQLVTINHKVHPGPVKTVAAAAAAAAAAWFHFRLRA